MPGYHKSKGFLALATNPVNGPLEAKERERKFGETNIFWYAPTPTYQSVGPSVILSDFHSISVPETSQSVNAVADMVADMVAYMEVRI